VASAISLLLCLATAASWARSYWREDELTWWRRPRHPGQLYNGQEPETMAAVRCTCGQLTFVTARFSPQYWIDRNGQLSLAPTVAMCWYFEHTTAEVVVARTRRGMGFHRWTLQDGTGETDNYIEFPLRSVMCATLLCPLVWCLRFVTRIEGSACQKCGYNLTGNTSGICPECGSPVPKEPAEKGPRHA
jgi:hypothetical protein